NEVDNRLSHFGGDNKGLRRDVVEGLIEFLDNHNALVQLLRTTHEKFLDSYVSDFKVRLYNVIGAQEYELPTGDMLGAIVYVAGPEMEMDYDIVIEQCFGQPQRVNKLHTSYMSLQFPLLSIYEEDGYSKEMKLVGGFASSFAADRRLSMKAYYAYFLHDHVTLSTSYQEREDSFNKMCISDIYDAIVPEDSDSSDCGGRLLLPQSFTGGPRYMYAHYLDALAICRVHGNPSFFITFLCNVNWPEISEYMDDFRDEDSSIHKVLAGSRAIWENYSR
ncbi:DNA helicase, partial [Tanacetum coccineum]